MHVITAEQSVECVIVKQCKLLCLSLALSQFLCHYADQENQYPFSFQLSISVDEFCPSKCLIIHRKVHHREKRLGQTLDWPVFPCGSFLITFLSTYLLNMACPKLKVFVKHYITKTC